MGRFFVTVGDNGCGIPEKPEGFGKDGIANMKARIGSIGGACDIRALPEGGTDVEMQLNLSH